MISRVGVEGTFSRLIDRRKREAAGAGEGGNGRGHGVFEPDLAWSKIWDQVLSHTAYC